MFKLINTLYKSILRATGIKIGTNVQLEFGQILARGYSGKKGDIVLNDNCQLSKGVVLRAYGGHISIGSNTFLGEYVCIYGHGDVQIGENTLIAMHTCILSSNHTIPNRNTLIRSQGDIRLPVKIGNDVWLGAGVKILGGVSIGNGCVVGAGAVVNKSLPDYAIAVGVPARVIGYRNG
ncbi:acyltransferase [Pedobacter duraquae]|uniref:Acetyltransferase-like isoleucine patch superfamily enzyme n=1 Tax=Pedobacter duraquae TaxID=425511 RepID=A0A4V3C3S0_9SPHI|nr:acyltransferase [Pedobacter duraquae]TDO23148.1 acetyltransferase-like isoleucine patch superfamily enzyme [Pedobacter duraquae]